MIIHVEYGDRNSIVELTEMERNELRACVKKEDQMHGFDVSDDKKYSRDDYLYIAFLVRQVISSYHRMNYIPVLNQWRAGYCEVPYIHVELFDGCAMIMRDGILVPNDKDLTVQITGPDNNNSLHLLP